jgi:hypothetical protein
MNIQNALQQKTAFQEEAVHDNKYPIYQRNIFTPFLIPGRKYKL